MFHNKITFIFFILSCLCLKLSLLQTIIIPIGPNFDDDDDDEDEDEKEKAYDDGMNPVIERREYHYNDNGNPITITHISYKSKNLSGNKGVMTPFQIMRSFDNTVNSIFEDFFRQSIGIRNILSEMEKEEEDFEKRIKKDFFADIIDENNDEKKEIDVGEGGDLTGEKSEKKIKRKIGKLNIDEEKLKKNMNKKKKKLSKKQLFFSRLCKYIFYSIILFTVYLLVKKLLEVLEIIEPEDYVEVKINNEPDEESINLKMVENKQN